MPLKAPVSHFIARSGFEFSHLLLIQQLMGPLDQTGQLEGQIDISGTAHYYIWGTPSKTFGTDWMTGVLRHWAARTLNRPDQISSLIRTLEGHQLTRFPAALTMRPGQGEFWSFNLLSGHLPAL